MKINFVLSPNSNTPIGGFKIVFQYANQLVKMGHDVSITFLISGSKSITRKLLSKVKNGILRNKDKKRVTWFDLNPKIKIYYSVIFQADFPESDVVIATAVQTADVVASLDDKYGKKFYFIQGRDTWGTSEQVVNDTYQLPLTKIVISRWLHDLVADLCNDPVYIVPNFLDDKIFYDSKSIDERTNTISMMYHTIPEKNSGFGVRVIEAVKKQIPDLKVEMFGVCTRPETLPMYIKYHYQASQDMLRDEIYGESKIYLVPSISEGWGLTGMEAMASGSVLVSSNVGGIPEYAKNGTNAILIEPNNFNGFVKKVVCVLNNDEYRKKLAYQGLNVGNEFSIEKSAKLLVKVLGE